MPQPRRASRAFAASAEALHADAGAGYGSIRFIPWGFLDPFYTAVVQGTEEAVVNALVANEDMTGRDGHRSPALPRERIAGFFAARPD